MDAYSDYMMRVARNRVADLHREAEIDRLARAARARRGSRRQRLRVWLDGRRSAGATAPTVTFPASAAATDTELRRSA